MMLEGWTTSLSAARRENRVLALILGEVLLLAVTVKNIDVEKGFCHISL